MRLFLSTARKQAILLVLQVTFQSRPFNSFQSAFSGVPGDTADSPARSAMLSYHTEEHSHRMIIGVPKEVKDHETRVGLVPSGANALREAGHQVLVQSTAGDGSTLSDDEYRQAGAEILPGAEDVWRRADLVVKVKEPQSKEYAYFRPGLTLFTYLHLAPLPDLTNRLLESKVNGVAYETIKDQDGSLPLLTPMSEVAGRMAVQIGAQYLEAPRGGRGVLLGGVPGVAPANCVIIGGGVVGTNAAKIAVGMGAHVIIIDRSLNRLRQLDDIFGARIVTLASNAWTIAETLRTADLVVGAVLIPGASAPKLVRKEMVARMKRGAVMVDVAIDQGGCFETSHATTHTDPTYFVGDVLHYCVSNMPAAVPHTSTFALTNATFPYLLELANKGLERACREHPGLRQGVNTYNGQVTHAGVAESQGRQCYELAGVV
jgi:alanine dehydrogenase